MSLFVVKHLLESTFVCLLLSAVARGLKRGAAARYAVLLLAVTKFAVPTVLLSQRGEQLAALWPAAPWISILTHHVLMMFATMQGVFPVSGALAIGVLWAVGTAVFLIGWLVSLRGGRVAMLLPSEEEQIVLLRMLARFRIRQTVQLRCTAADWEPALRGVWRPTITVPRGLREKLTAAEFEGVLLHELAHLRRFDNLMGVFVHALVCLLLVPSVALDH